MAFHSERPSWNSFLRTLCTKHRQDMSMRYVSNCDKGMVPPEPPNGNLPDSTAPGSMSSTCEKPGGFRDLNNFK